MLDDPRSGLPSASSFAIDVACPGRQNLLRELPPPNGSIEQEPSEYAARGTRIHKARATGSTFELSEDEVAAYDEGCRLERSVLTDWATENQIQPIPDAMIPGRLWLYHPETGDKLLSGELDVLYIAAQNALINDWKTGSAYYVTRAGKSWQLRIYALLAWKEWPQLTRIRVAFIKPEAFGQRTNEAEFSEYDLRNIERATYHVLWKSQQPDAPRVAGTHCVYCPAKAICEEAAQYAMLPAIVRRSTEDETLDLIRAMSTDALAAVWKRRNEVEKIFDAIDERLRSLPPEELDRLNLKLTAGKKMDSITDIIGAFNALRASDFSSEQILNAMEFNKGKIIGLIQQKLYCREAEAKALYENALDPFITRSRAKPSIVEQ